MMMSKTIVIITLTLITFSLTKSDDTGADTRIGKTMSGISMMSSTSKDQERIKDLDMEEIMNDCNDTFRTEMSFLEALNNSGSFPDEVDRTPKCYIRCVLEKMLVVSEDGEFDVTQAAAVFAGERDGKPMDDLQDLAMACAVRKETCKCERSYNFMKCLMSMEIEKYERGH